MTPHRTLWLLYAAFIVYGATIPFHFAGNTGAILEHARAVSLDPFVSPETGRRLSFPDVVQNILLFLPFGALGIFGTARPGRNALRRVALVTLLGLTASLVVESLQLLTADRVASLGDVLANTAGAFLGAVATWQLSGLFTSGLGRLKAAGLADADELRPFAIASLALAVAFWQPFDVTLDVSTTVGKIRALQTDVWQFTSVRDEGTTLMLSMFFSMTLTSYLSVLGQQHAGRTAALIGIISVLLLEGSQALIASRTPGLWDVTIAASGILAGIIVWSAAARIVWPRLWMGVMVALTASAAALQMLSPFDWAPVYHSMGWFPFWGYYVHTTFETLSHVFELVLLYVPLGFFIGKVGTGGRRTVWLAVGLTLAIAGPIEYLQGWVVGRYPDITDLGISLCGGWIGAWAAGASENPESRQTA